MLACNSSSKLVTDMELGQGRGNKVITRAKKGHRLRDPGLVCMDTRKAAHGRKRSILFPPEKQSSQ